jgi:hypothetical protein
MNNDKNIRFLTKEEMTAVAGGHTVNGEDCGFEHITVSAPNYPPTHYGNWITIQNSVMYEGGGTVSGSIGLVSGGIGANATYTGTDLNNDGILDKEITRYQAYVDFMDEQGYGGPYNQIP